VTGPVWLRRLAILVLGSALVRSGHAQQPPAVPPPIEGQTRKNVAAPCLEPPPLVRWEEYQGPFQKVVGALAQTFERKSVRQPHYKPCTLLCSFEPKDKFILFVQDSFDPLSFLTAGFNAGLDQARNQDPAFGQGAEGYRRIPDDIFRRCYYRLAHGSREKRFLHAIGHTFVAHRDNGKYIFNFSEWMGPTGAAMLSNAYTPATNAALLPQRDAWATRSLRTWASTYSANSSQISPTN